MENRLSTLRDVAIGSEKTLAHSSPLSLAHYECLMDVLATLHQECSGSLSRDKNASKFARKCELNKYLTITIYTVAMFS